MEKTKQKVLEALQMQPLSEEEKASRHILGRLYGPIATSLEKTRNGRGYNRALWEKALADEIFKEKIANKSLFLELGHPADREETDMKLVCACIPEMPKIVDGDLYAYVDILDTENGRLLKTLCDYGFVPGISSRGSGDIMANDEVDPDTFFLETWDIVQLPAVKKARLSVCESFDGKKPLKAVLQESYNAASDEDKKVMKETLEKLDISLDENLDECNKAPVKEAAEEADVLPGGTPKDPDLVPDLPDGILNEEGGIEGQDTKVPTPTNLVDPNLEDQGDTLGVLADDILCEEEAPVEEAPVEEAPVEEPVEEVVEDTAATVGAFADQFKDYDKDLALEFKPIVIDDKEYKISDLEFDDSEEGKVVVSINYSLPEEGDDEEAVEEPAEDKAEDAAEEAGDAGDEEVIESLKEAVRQKDLLENEVTELKNQKTVSDAKVNELKEELEKYKDGFIRTSELAAKSGKFEKEVNLLKEQLSQKDTEIKDLQKKVEKHTSLTESVNANEAKIKALTEQLAAVNAEADKNEEDLTKQLNESRQLVKDRTNLAKSYKAKYNAVVERYIANKANMLGVRPQDITSKLAESYSLDDIDKVCDDLLTEGRPQFSLGYSTRNRATVNESVKPQIKDDSLNDLLTLAGLDYSDIK